MTIATLPYHMVPIGTLAHPEPGSFKIGPFGSTLKKDELVANGIPVVGIENVLANRFVPSYRKFITKAKFKQLSQYAIAPGDVLVTTMGTIGRAAVVPGESDIAIFDSHLFRMRVERSKVNPQFLCYAINGYEALKKELRRMACGAIMAGLNTTILRACSIPLPSLTEQKRIVLILSKQMAVVEKARVAAEAQLEAAEVLAPAFFRAVFESVEAQRWPKKTLDEICEEKTGSRDPRMKPNQQFCYVDISSVDNKTKRITEPKLLQGAEAPSRARQVIHVGDVIVSTTRPNLNAVALVPEELNNQICSTGFCVLRPKAQLDSGYLFANVQSYGFVQNLTNVVKGALYPAVTDSQVRAQTILLPLLSEQKRIALILAEKILSAKKVINQLQEQLETINKMPAALLRKAFNGEL